MIECVNPNLCENCIEAANSTVLSFGVADTGRCGCCGAVGEVFDLELINFYLALGLPQERVSHYLPRLRSSHCEANKAETPLSWSDVGRKVAPLIQVL